MKEGEPVEVEQKQETNLKKYKIDNYKETKINHLSILANAFLFKEFDEIKNIMLANIKIISLNQIEEDGLETISYLLDSEKCTFEEKFEIAKIYFTKIKREDIIVHTNFISLCVAKNQSILLLKLLEENIIDINDPLVENVREDIKEQILSQLQLQKYFSLYQKVFKNK